MLSHNLSLAPIQVSINQRPCLGWLSCQHKCAWDPIQSHYTWLCNVWDGGQSVMSITETRLQKSLAHIDKALLDLDLSAHSAGDLASLAGKIISMSAVLRNLSSILTKHYQMSCRSSTTLGLSFPFWQILYNLRPINSRNEFHCNPHFTCYGCH